MAQGWDLREDHNALPALTTLTWKVTREADLRGV